MIEDLKGYALIVTTSIVRGISVVRRNYSTQIAKRKKNKNVSNLIGKKQKRLLQPYLVMH